MSEPIAPSRPDVMHATSLKAVCDGPAQGRHPRVFLTMVDDAQGHPSHVVCPYCSRVFRYAGAARETRPATGPGPLATDLTPHP